MAGWVGADVQERSSNAGLANIHLNRMSCVDTAASSVGGRTTSTLEDASRPGGVVALTEGATLALWCAHVEK